MYTVSSGSPVFIFRVNIVKISSLIVWRYTSVTSHLVIVMLQEKIIFEFFFSEMCIKLLRMVASLSYIYLINMKLNFQFAHFQFVLQFCLYKMKMNIHVAGFIFSFIYLQLPLVNSTVKYCYNPNY